MSNFYLLPVVTIPSALEITAITNAYPMVVTVSANSDQMNTYIVGMLVILTVPVTYKMIQANGLTGQIIAVGTDTLTLGIDSTLFDAFIVPLSGEQPASLAPAGSRNLQYSNTTAALPFQSFNNIGN